MKIRQRYLMFLIIPFFWPVAGLLFLWVWLSGRDLKAFWKEFVEIHKWGWKN